MLLSFTNKRSIVFIPLVALLVARYLDFFPSRRETESTLLYGVIRPAASEWEIGFNGFPWELSTIPNLTMRSWLKSFSSIAWIVLASDVAYSPFIHNARELPGQGDSGDEWDVRVGLMNESLLEHGFTLMPFPGHERFSPADASEKKNFDEALRSTVLKFYPAAEEVLILNYNLRHPDSGYVPFVHRDYHEPHLDISTYSDDEFPPPEKERFLETDNEKIVILGAWKPNKLGGTGRHICKDSLALLSQSPKSLRRGDMKRVFSNYINPNGILFTNRTFLGLVSHRDRQQWHYYPNMTESELLIFTHLDYRREARNPRTGVFHSSFDPPESSCDVDTVRRAVETRIFLRF